MNTNEIENNILKPMKIDGELHVKVESKPLRVFLYEKDIPDDFDQDAYKIMILFPEKEGGR